jgi:hypothetical protein
MGRPRKAEVKEVFPVRLAGDVVSALQAEAEVRRDNASEVIRLHLHRYAELVWRDLPRLREGEWCVVFEALGGVPVDVSAVRAVGATVADAVGETDLARKWKVDAGELAAAARAWTFGQAIAVADAAARFHAALTEKEGTEALEAARTATTRPAALVLQPPTSRAPKSKAAEPSRGRAGARAKRG